MTFDHFSIIIYLWFFTIIRVWSLLTFKCYKQFDFKIKHVCFWSFATVFCWVEINNFK